MVVAVSNLRENVAPLSMGPESNEPSSAVTLCLAASLFVHTTVEPAGTVTSAGTNLKPTSSILMVPGAPVEPPTAVVGTAVGVVASPHADRTRPRQQRIASCKWKRLRVGRMLLSDTVYSPPLYANGGRVRGRPY